MSTNHDWNDAYVVLKHRAEEVRGFIEVNPGTPDWERWPRTIGADVIAIAAVVDPCMKQLHRADGIQRRWHACLAGIERYALVAPAQIYRENRELWRCLAAAFVHLASIDAPLPDPFAWSVLLDELGQVLRTRNGPSGDGPFKHFDHVKTYDDLSFAQYKYLLDVRGGDELGPETGPNAAYGKGGTVFNVPRTTNADVIALTDYWTKQLAAAKDIGGVSGVERRWKLVRDDVDQLARRADPSAVYAKNNGFWRELKHLAIHVAAADEAPSKWDIALDSLKDSVTHLPENLKAGATKAADFLGDVAQGVGKVANEAGKGLFAGLGAPLLIGGGLLGLFLLSRARATKEVS
jgi:hypothetical protein